MTSAPSARELSARKVAAAQLLTTTAALAPRLQRGVASYSEKPQQQFLGVNIPSASLARLKIEFEIGVTCSSLRQCVRARRR